jgi:hypothetical protein
MAERLDTTPTCRRLARLAEEMGVVTYRPVQKPDGDWALLYLGWPACDEDGRYLRFDTEAEAIEFRESK